jgi:hypothetical protein
MFLKTPTKLYEITKKMLIFINANNIFAKLNNNNNNNKYVV